MCARLEIGFGCRSLCQFDRSYRQTIVDETDRIAGKQRGVSSQPIILRVSSPNAVPLTLVDTPGLTRVAVDNQPADVESKIK